MSNTSKLRDIKVSQSYESVSYLGKTKYEYRIRSVAKPRSASNAKHHKALNTNSKASKVHNVKRNRTQSVAQKRKHQRYESISKENRILSTWNKIEIAEWLEKHWNNKNKNCNTNLSSYIHKIKREKRFDGKNIHKLNDRYLNILAKRYLGLKQGDLDYNLFIKSMRELKATYCSKTNRNLYKERCPKKERKRKRHSASNPVTSAACAPNHICSFPFSTNSYPQEYELQTPILNLSETSPAHADADLSDIDIDIETNGDYGVTADELLYLISSGLCDSDYDTDSYIMDYIATSHTPSPKQTNIDEYEEYKYTQYKYKNKNKNKTKNKNKNKNKTTVIPSILTVNLSTDDIMPTVCLSPMASRNTMIRCYSMTDESTDDDDDDASQGLNILK